MSLTHSGTHSETDGAGAEGHDAYDAHDAAAPATLHDEVVEVRHRGGLAAGVALVASCLMVAWLARALFSGGVVSWVVVLLLGLVALVEFGTLREARTPLMVADHYGIRIRQRRAWHGLRWEDIADVEVRQRGSLLADGAVRVRAIGGEQYAVPLAVTTRTTSLDLSADLDRLTEGRVAVVEVEAEEPAEAPDEAPDQAPEPALDQAPEEPAYLAPEERASVAPEPTDEAGATDAVEETADVARPDESATLAGAEEEPQRRWRPRAWLSLLSLPPRDGRDDEVVGETDDDDDLGELGERAEEPGERGETGEPEDLGAPEPEPEPEPEPVDGLGPVEAFDPVLPARQVRPVARAEVHRESSGHVVPAQRHADQAGIVRARADVAASQGDEVSDPEETVAVAAAPIDDLAASTRPVDPVIGPEIAAARRRSGLSIDQLSDRTRIRPHLLECIEVDDFGPCGGDFYARGHLRTLARTFGLDAADLLATYDARYAHAPIEARQVFEAELASGIGGGTRSTLGGPRWTLIAASVVLLAAVWGLARVVTGGGEDQVLSPAPMGESAGLAGQHSGAQAGAAKKPALAPIEVRVTDTASQVVVRDRDGQVIFADNLAAGKTEQLIGFGPFEVTASHGGSVHVSVLHKDRGTVGEGANPASRRFD